MLRDMDIISNSELKKLLTLNSPPSSEGRLTPHPRFRTSSEIPPSPAGEGYEEGVLGLTKKNNANLC